MTDAELKDLVASLAVSQAKTDAQMAKNDTFLTRKFAETDAQMVKNDAFLTKKFAKTDAQMAKTDAQMTKTDAQMAKTDAKLKRAAEMLGGIGNNQGEVAEEFFYNSFGDKPAAMGINYDFIEKNVTRKSRGVEDEYDLLLVNGSDVLVIEVKYKAHLNDLKRLLEKKAVNFKKLFPEYQHYRQHWALASFHINDDLKQAALHQGVTVFQRKGDVVETLAA